MNTATSSKMPKAMPVAAPYFSQVRSLMCAPKISCAGSVARAYKIKSGDEQPRRHDTAGLVTP